VAKRERIANQAAFMVLTPPEYAKNPEVRGFESQSGHNLSSHISSLSAAFMVLTPPQ
jgi:hypothetical protein